LPPQPADKVKLSFVKLIPEDREKLAKLTGRKVERPLEVAKPVLVIKKSIAFGPIQLALRKFIKTLPVTYSERKQTLANTQPKEEQQSESENTIEELTPLAEKPRFVFKYPELTKEIESGSSKSSYKPTQKSTGKPTKKLLTNLSPKARKTVVTNRVHNTVMMSVMEGQLVQLIKKIDPQNLPKQFSRTVQEMALKLTKKFKLDANNLTKNWYRSFLMKNPEIVEIASIATYKRLPKSTVEQQSISHQQLTHDHNAEIVDRIISTPVEEFTQDFYSTVVQIASAVAKKYNIPPVVDGQQRCYGLMAEFPILIEKKQAVNKFQSENRT
jgi:hypothetical protein